MSQPDAIIFSVTFLLMCCCCVIILGIAGAAIYFIFGRKKDDGPNASSAPGMPDTPSPTIIEQKPVMPSASASNPFGPVTPPPPNPFNAPAAPSAPDPFASRPAEPAGPPPGDARAALLALGSYDKAYTVEPDSAFRYVIKWNWANPTWRESLTAQGVNRDYKLEIALDDPSRTATFTEAEAQAPITDVSGNVIFATDGPRNDARAALEAVGWKVQ
jgi:hypothetical protein